MADLMFIEVLRRHVEALGEEQTGWLAALQDPVVGAALSRLHERPAHHWSLVELARGVAVSRTVLAERFTRLVGMPPMRYLAQWRLQLAADRLAHGGLKVAAVGAEVGYESEAAFSRAFKRATGLSPAGWRRQRSGPPDARRPHRSVPGPSAAGRGPAADPNRRGSLGQVPPPQP